MRDGKKQGSQGVRDTEKGIFVVQPGKWKLKKGKYGLHKRFSFWGRGERAGSKSVYKIIASEMI